MSVLACIFDCRYKSLVVGILLDGLESLLGFDVHKCLATLV
jgi:hypothetical protein